MLLFCVKFSVAQSDTLYVEKRSCSLSNQNNGYKLIIHYKNGNSIEPQQPFSYSLTYLQSLSNSEKLLIVGELLKYANDTSLCCQYVRNENFNGVDIKGGAPSSIKNYPIAVDALFMINRICWPKLTERYSPAPVLYDTIGKVVINDNPKAICCFVKEYEAWYKECKKKGNIPKYFPFNKGRYIWYSGKIDINDPANPKGIFDEL